MKIQTSCFALLLLFSSTTLAEEAESSKNTGYISENLFIYMHSGPGKNYRIVGSANAGDKIQTTGKNANNYREIINQQNKTGWVESQYISNKISTLDTISNLNNTLDQLKRSNEQLTQKVNDANHEIRQYKLKEDKVNKELSTLSLQLKQSQERIKTQDLELQKEWFYNGAIVLACGLLLGLIVPRIFTRKTSKIESWK